ncbi:DUF4974 domain-containing protein [Pedobacter sp. HDW13]|uniref:FecR family protein n=1 Tax=Pedobacter sp. HDW13 TaxID=2714940 RepID=UPI00140E1961|nr:FecR family protein [Pedobacter sp. HDW13]QIL40464.1 DUF4974 domain-containing protein [Pedobacter sp. HDW13]
MEDINGELLEKYAQAKCTPLERMQVEAWLELEDFPAFLAVEQEQVKPEILSALQEKMQPRPKKFRLTWRVYSSIAAATVLALGFLLLNRTQSLPQNIVFNAPYGQPTLITLPDSSKIELQPGSRIAYPSKFTGKTRPVTLLSGEVFFVVKHDASKPFLVKSANSEIKVLGTRFNVRNLKSATLMEVTLTQGKISFKAKNSPETILLPGERLFFNKTQQRTGEVTKVDTNAVTAWKSGLIKFSDTPMPQVLETLENRYGLRFKVSCTLNDPISGKFEKQSVSQVLQLIQRASDYRFRNAGKYIEIYK